MFEILQRAFKAVKSAPSSEAPAKRLGKLIQLHRKKRGWAQKELASRVGISKSYICKIEKGQVPPEKTLKKISEAFGLSLEEWGTLLYLRLKAVNPESIAVLERKRFSLKD